MASDRGIDWIYEGTASKNEQKRAEQEDFLLGKEYNPSNVKNGDLTLGNESVGLSKIVKSVDNRSYDNTRRPERNEGFHMRHEDPMFMVNQTRREKEKSQRKKKELFETTASSLRGEKKKKGRRSDKRSRSKREPRGRSYSVSSSDDEGERRRRRKKKDKRRKRKRRSYSSDSEDSKNRRRRQRKHDRRDRSISRSRSSSPERKYRKHKHDVVKERSSRRDRSRSRSYDRNRKLTSSRHDDGSERNKGRKKDYKTKRHNEENDESGKQSSPTQQKSYGLISVGKPVASSRKESCSLGPDEELLAKKRQEKEDVRNACKRRGRNHNDTKMSAEERAAALDTMLSDANQRDAYLSKASATKKVDLHDEEIQRRMREGSKEMSSFVQDMVMKTEENNLSMSEYVARNKSSIQKASDDRFL